MQTLEKINLFETLLTPAAIANPYAVYDQVRETDPIHWNPMLQAWMFTRYSDVLALFQDNRLSSNWPSVFAFGRELDEAEQVSFKRLLKFFEAWMQANDGPRHTRIRGLVQKAFTPRMLQRLQATIEQVTDELLDAVAANGQMDVMAALAKPLPSAIISEMLDLPREIRGRFYKASEAVISFIGTTIPQPGQLAYIEQEVDGIFEMFQPLLEERRQHPGQDLISDLLHSQDDGEEPLTVHELISNCVFLLIAGHETTTNLLGNGLWVLLNNPEQMERLRNEPALMKSAVEEFLRIYSPVQWVPRCSLQEFVVDGKLIKPGQGVWLGLGAANHDPAQFSRPTELDITRNEGRHVALGFGAHHCLGASLTRLEAQIVFTRLLERFEDIQFVNPAAQPEWNENFTIRGLKTLPVKFRAR